MPFRPLIIKLIPFPNIDTQYLNLNDATCDGKMYAYWDPTNVDRFDYKDIFQPLFARSIRDRKSLDLECQDLCTGESRCAGYAVASDSFWNRNWKGFSHGYVCSHYESCNSTVLGNGNYRGYMKLHAGI